MRYTDITNHIRGRSTFPITRYTVNVYANIKIEKTKLTRVDILYRGGARSTPCITRINSVDYVVIKVRAYFRYIYLYRIVPPKNYKIP